MSKKKEKELPNSLKNSLEGFEDFIQSHHIHIHKKPTYDKSDEGQIQTFLENNYNRLIKTSDLFQKKLQQLEKYDISESQEKKLKEQNKIYKDKIIKNIENTHSKFNRSLSAIFDSFFSH